MILSLNRQMSRVGAEMPGLDPYIYYSLLGLSEADELDPRLFNFKMRIKSGQKEALLQSMDQGKFIAEQSRDGGRRIAEYRLDNLLRDGSSLKIGAVGFYTNGIVVYFYQKDKPACLSHITFDCKKVPDEILDLEFECNYTKNIPVAKISYQTIFTGGKIQYAFTASVDDREPCICLNSQA